MFYFYLCNKMPPRVCNCGLHTLVGWYYVRIPPPLKCDIIQERRRNPFLRRIWTITSQVWDSVVGAPFSFEAVVEGAFYGVAIEVLANYYEFNHAVAVFGVPVGSQARVVGHHLL